MEKSTSSRSSYTGSPTSNADSSNKETPGTEFTLRSPCSVGSADDPTFGQLTENLPPTFPLWFSTQNFNSVKVGSASIGGIFDPFQAAEPRTFPSGPGSLSPTAAAYTPLSVEDQQGYSPELTPFPSFSNSASSCLLASPAESENFADPLKTETNFVHSPPRISSPQDWATALLTDQATRVLKISNLRGDIDLSRLNSAFAQHTFKVPKILTLSQLSSNGVVYAYFPDIRDSCKALTEISAGHPEWLLDFSGQLGFKKTLDAEYQLDDDPAILIIASCYGQETAFEPSMVVAIIHNFLASFGQIRTWGRVRLQFPDLIAQIEFFDSEVAHKLRELHEVRLSGLMLRLQHCRFLRVVPQSPMEATSHDQNTDHRTTRMLSSSKFSDSSNSPVEPFSPDWIATPNRLDNSPTSGMPYGMKDNWEWSHDNSAISRQKYVPPVPGYATQATNRRFGSRLERQGQGFGTGHHNVVDVARITQGMDVRTTIMLRNIPNKITQAMLKDIVDETSRGKYDFMYLRIDFANNCNVGYAFINFEDPWHIVDFVKARAGRRWNCFNSDKIAEVSYATIQGKDCLVQKFRNSSVMMEHPSFRPKIFITGSSPDAGHEEDFPGPDNSSKMRRSVENAEHVGLFAPRTGQHLRDEQRRRRSQFDRGTRYAELETVLHSARAIHPTGCAF